MKVADDTSKELLSVDGLSWHGLSQQGVWVPFWTPKPLKRATQDTQLFGGGISKNLNLKLIIEFFHLLIIPMTLFYNIMPYFDEFIHVNGWNMSIMWFPLKIWRPKNFTTANFRHPVSKSWLRHWLGVELIVIICVVLGRIEYVGREGLGERVNGLFIRPKKKVVCCL